MFLNSDWWVISLFEYWLNSLIEYLNHSAGDQSLNWSGVVALCWEPRHRNEQKIKILWPPFHLTISDTLRNWTSKIEIWPRITAFISEIFSTITGPSADVGGQGKWKSGQFCLVPVRPDRQRADFFYNSDRIRTADRIDTDRIRTDRHRTENPDRIRTADRHRTRFSGKSG